MPSRSGPSQIELFEPAALRLSYTAMGDANAIRRWRPAWRSSRRRLHRWRAMRGLAALARDVAHVDLLALGTREQEGGEPYVRCYLRRADAFLSDERARASVGGEPRVLRPRAQPRGHARRCLALLRAGARAYARRGPGLYRDVSDCGDRGRGGARRPRRCRGRPRTAQRAARVPRRQRQPAHPRPYPRSVRASRSAARRPRGAQAPPRRNPHLVSRRRRSRPDRACRGVGCARAPELETASRRASPTSPAWPVFTNTDALTYQRQRA